MRIVLQRAASASVMAEGTTVGQIGKGILALVGVEEGDTDDDARWLAAKTIALRIFDDSNGIMNLSVKDVGGSILSISQFTLTASTRRGNRPSYIRAARHETATRLYDLYSSLLSQDSDIHVEKGIFGANMQVSLVNDGPVTIIIDSRLRE